MRWRHFSLDQFIKLTNFLFDQNLDKKIVGQKRPHPRNKYNRRMSNDKIEYKPPTYSFYFSWRFLLSIIGFVGYMTIYMQKINMGIGIVW